MLLLFSYIEKVLLIHDPETDREAAAMDVRVGSLSNPPSLLGLAHFCEHMLFDGHRYVRSQHSHTLAASAAPDEVYTLQ